MILKIIRGVVFFFPSFLFSLGQFEVAFDLSADFSSQEKIEEILINSEKFFTRLTGFIPKEVFHVRVTDSLSSYQALGFPIWLGGFYHNREAILQPLEILIQKNLLAKTLFIEYAHFFIDSFTRDKCPGWLNEMLSIYYYEKFSERGFLQTQKNQRLFYFKDFIKLAQNLKDRNKSLAFFQNSVIFAFLVEKKKTEIFWLNMLKSLRSGKVLENEFHKQYGKSMKKVYDDEME